METKITRKNPTTHPDEAKTQGKQRIPTFMKSGMFENIADHSEIFPLTKKIVGLSSMSSALSSPIVDETREEPDPPTLLKL